MNSIQFARFAAGVAAATLMAAAGAASAQQPAAAAATPPVKSGPPIAGLCVLSQQRAVGASQVGQYVSSRMKQLQAQVQAELQPEATSLNNDLKSYQAQAASLTPEARKAREVALQQRVDGIQRKQQLRGRELEATEGKAVNRIVTELNPIARSAYEQRNCSILLDAQAVIFPNPGTDITDTVIAGLNAKLTTFPFEREHLDQQAAGAAPAAARPPVKKN
jgi:outer membrane protein